MKKNEASIKDAGHTPGVALKRQQRNLQEEGVEEDEEPSKKSKTDSMLLTQRVDCWAEVPAQHPNHGVNTHQTQKSHPWCAF